MISSRACFAAFLVIAIAVVPQLDSAKSGGQESASKDGTIATDDAIVELRARARLLHDAFHATLQVVHHHYYREDEGLLIPAAVLKQVFDDLEKRHQVTLRWLAVDAQPMSREHEPRTEFEKQAVARLARGRSEHEIIEDGVYRRAASIRLANECLKCHLPNRTSTADRTAALLIEIPLRRK